VVDAAAVVDDAGGTGRARAPVTEMLPLPLLFQVLPRSTAPL